MTDALKTFYVTTPIYYVNDVPHIGHAYTTVAADCVARFRRLKGYKVLFLTGTDEHGQKVEKAAAASGLKPIEFADRVVQRFQGLWKQLRISNNDFIRTTEPRHAIEVTKLWETVKKNGDIYLGEYEDWYCTACETFLTETQLKDGKCPDCGRPVERLKEESYFFRLSKYGEALLRHIEETPGFIQPENKKNEVMSFVKEGLRDLSVSRTTFSWGIPVPGDSRHVMYVWFDALTNYLTASKGFWPADIHIIGKDILRFHAVYWPAFLMSAGLPLPKKVFAHGWWTVDGNKMSKSKGVPPEINGKDRIELEKDIKGLFKTLPNDYSDRIGGLEFHQALNQLWVIIRKMNAFVDKAAPWKEKDEETLSNVLYTLAEGLRIMAVYLFPFMPDSAEKMWEGLGIEGGIEEIKDFDRVVAWGGKGGAKIKKGPPLFPRIA
jgi:methionine--tRNA ligase